VEQNDTLNRLGVDYVCDGQTDGRNSEKPNVHIFKTSCCAQQPNLITSRATADDDDVTRLACRRRKGVHGALDAWEWD